MNPKNPTKRLLMICYPFPPNASAGAVRSERFARYLSEIGWDIDVITIKSRDDLFNDNNRLENLKEFIHIHQTSNFDPWLTLMNMKTSNRVLNAVRSVLMIITSFPDHLIYWVPSAVLKAKKLYKENKYDIIYTTSPPHTSQLAGLIISMRTKTPWLADFRDPWTLNALHGKKGKFNFFKKFEEYLEKLVLKKSSKILANTKSNRSKLLNAFSFLTPEKVIHLPNGWEGFSQKNSSEISEQNNKKKLTIVHSGTFYEQFNPYALLYAIAKWNNNKQPQYIYSLKDNDLEIILLGARNPKTKKIVKKLNIDKFVTILPWVSQEKSREFMCNADLLWATLGTGKESSTFIPSKIFEYISAKKPIIGFFPEGEAEALIRETSTGTVFTSNDSDSIIKFLYKKMINNHDDYKPNEINVKKYNIKFLVSQLDSVMKELLK